jgi:hypothetical protein
MTKSCTDIATTRTSRHLRQLGLVLFATNLAIVYAIGRTRARRAPGANLPSC